MSVDLWLLIIPLVSLSSSYVSKRPKFMTWCQNTSVFHMRVKCQPSHNWAISLLQRTAMLPCDMLSLLSGLYLVKGL
jgi:hypothetical protein